MGTHPIFESDFDCLTEESDRKVERHETECVLPGHRLPKGVRNRR